MLQESLMPLTGAAALQGAHKACAGRTWSRLELSWRAESEDARSKDLMRESLLMLLQAAAPDCEDWD
jgi:hypothetical protein